MPLSPMMQRYIVLKEKYKDCLVFYRLGDFYEMFFDDALTASKELQLTLTGRDCGRKRVRSGRTGSHVRRTVS